MTVSLEHHWVWQKLSDMGHNRKELEGPDKKDN